MIWVDCQQYYLNIAEPKGSKPKLRTYSREWWEEMYGQQKCCVLNDISHYDLENENNHKQESVEKPLKVPVATRIYVWMKNLSASVNPWMKYWLNPRGRGAAVGMVNDT